MIEVRELPAAVFFELNVSGSVTDAEYTDALVPALDQAI